MIEFVSNRLRAERLNPPEDEVDFGPTHEAFVELSVVGLMPGRSEDSISDRSEIGVGAHPECVVGEDPLVNILVAKPDAQRI